MEVNSAWGYRIRFLDKKIIKKCGIIVGQNQLVLTEIDPVSF
jgi:hypothetical protein